MGHWTDIDVYRDGACVYQNDARGDILWTAGWTRSHLAAVEIFNHMCRYEPKNGFSVR